MYTPQYLIRLNSEQFNDTVVCLGTQLLNIVDCIKDYLPEHNWYISDILINNSTEEILSFEPPNLKKIGNLKNFKEFVSQVDQFIWGVFIAVEAENSVSENLEAYTEDIEFRNLDIDGVILEIRAFDTTFFQICSEDLGIIKRLAQKYQLSQIITSSGQIIDLPSSPHINPDNEQ